MAEGSATARCRSASRRRSPSSARTWPSRASSATPGQGYVGQYIHLGGKIGVQVEFAGVTPAIAQRDEFATLVKEIAMQIAAASPTYVSRDDVPADVLEKEKAIYRAQMENSGKPANVIDKIVEGKLGSFYEQVVLPDQASIRDPKMTGRRTCSRRPPRRSARRSR